MSVASRVGQVAQRLFRWGLYAVCTGVVIGLFVAANERHLSAPAQFYMAVVLGSLVWGGAILAIVFGVLRLCWRPWTQTTQQKFPAFADVGGYDRLKAELSAAVDKILSARRTPATRNGILLYGPPGVGKTFFARALANDKGLRFVSFGTQELTSMWKGESARLVAHAFGKAKAQAPCVLFFDELDGVVANRNWKFGPDPGGAGTDQRERTDTFLQQVEQIRRHPGVVLMAATNHIEALDPAVIREGRFDYKMKLPLPNHEERKAVLGAQLRLLQAGAVDLDLVGRRTEGYSQARLQHLLESAKSLAHGARVETSHILAALRASMGAEKDQPGKRMTWADLILPEPLLDKLRMLQALLEQPELHESLGLSAPTGALFTGPPGTGKTSAARVLASESTCSFYAVTAADILGDPLGPAASIKALFDRARAHQPSIVFFDEIDGLAGTRGTGTLHDRQLTEELLAQIDGFGDFARVFVIGATNRPDLVDPAFTRGGRLTWVVEFGLPDGETIERLLRYFTRAVKVGALDYTRLVTLIDEMAPADIEALVNEAGQQALIRLTKTGGPAATAVVEMADFEMCLRNRRPSIEAGSAKGYL